MSGVAFAWDDIPRIIILPVLVPTVSIPRTISTVPGNDEQVPGSSLAPRNNRGDPRNGCGCPRNTKTVPRTILTRGTDMAGLSVLATSNLFKCLTARLCHSLQSLCDGHAGGVSCRPVTIVRGQVSQRKEKSLILTATMSLP